MSTVSNASSGGGVEGGGRGSGSASPVPPGMGPSGGGRVYHPYAPASRSASAHSSPAVYNTPLGPADGGVPTTASAVAGQQGLRRSESRTSFVGHPGVTHPLHHHQMESPAPYASMELPSHQPPPQQQGVYGYDSHQHGQQQDGEYYSHAI
jgi:hypothetical protein